MSDQHIDLTNQILREVGGDRAQIVDILAWLDDHPDQVPGRTMKKSDYQELMDGTSLSYGVGFTDGFHLAGGSVVPDPEPTNAERLEATLLDTFGLLETLGNQGVHNLAFNLDKAGVKAKTNQEES